jgi:hypothetical protein
MTTINLGPADNDFIMAESHFPLEGARPATEGWSHQGDCTLSFNPTDGNPGGCLMAVDAISGGVFYYLAPAKFLGAKGGALRLEYDIKWVASPDLPIFAWDREVEIAGRGIVLIFHPGTPARGKWVHCVVPFTAAGWKNVTNNRPATDRDFATVLSSLSKLAIRGEFAHGGPEIGYLDNVVMYRKLIGVDEKIE